MTGSIKDYTPNFNLIIPEFNITGWHDYLEENFRSIDAMFYNVFAINGYKGLWKNSTTYNVNDVVFVDDKGEYNGRLFKILVQHTTPGTGTFTEFYEDNPTLYDRFKDATDAAISAQEARAWAVKLDGPVEDDLYSSKFYANIVNDLSTEITTLYNIRSDIQNVSLIGTEVVNVSNIKNSIQTVANNTTNINTVANSITSVNTVADNINTINAVNNNAININSVANNSTNINAVNANKTNINTVASNSSNINTVSTNISDINTAASNITDIQNASGNAARAKNWAIKTDGLVDGEDYSAKHYAEIASQHENPLRIGQIIESTIPLTDAGLHLLDGSLIQGSGIYSEFVTYIAGLVSDYPDLFTTEANWQTSITNFGSCEKFVYDSVNNTVRLPKRVTEHGYLVKSYSNGVDWYRIYSDGWCEQGSYSSTNVEGTDPINLFVSYKDTDYMIYITSAANNNASGHTLHAIANTQNKTVSSFYTSVNDYYGTSTVIGYWKACGYVDITNYKGAVYEYIVLATSTKTDIQVDIDEIVTDLNGKADVDLSNINPTQTVKNTIVSWSIPDYTAGISVTANQDYMIPKSGELIISTRAGSTTGDFIIEVNGTQYTLASINWTYTHSNVYAYLTFEKDDVIKIIPNGTPQYATYTFYPFRGV